MPRLIMNQGHQYVVHGKTVHAGEEFDAPEPEDRLWKLLGRARDAPPKVKSMNEPEPPPPPPPEKRGPGRPRKYPMQGPPTYNRRDMRAEDE